jgi:hypothetical protein
MGGFLNLGLLQGMMGRGLNTLKVKPSNCDILCDYVHIITVFHCCVVLILFVLKSSVL